MRLPVWLRDAFSKTMRLVISSLNLVMVQFSIPSANQSLGKLRYQEEVKISTFLYSILKIIVIQSNSDGLQTTHLGYSNERF